MKGRESLNRKIALPGKSYETLSDITDICGVRIIVYFSSDVDRVAALLQREFTIDWENWSDKRAEMEPNEFGYISLHHVVSLNELRSGLAEYGLYSGVKAEIQIRSVLQHAWAEIEHDLGYKSEREIPRIIRRRFSQLAGLLELADEQFNGIRSALGQYESGIGESIQSAPQSVSIDGVTVRWFILNDSRSLRMDEAICAITGGAILEEYDIAPALTGRLGLLGLTTIDELIQITRDFYDETLALARLIAPATQLAVTGVPLGSGVFYLCYIAAAAAGGKELFYSVATHMAEASEERDAEAVTQAIADMARELLVNSGKLPSVEGVE